MDDPLSALRQAITSKSPITYSNGEEQTETLLSATHLVINSTPFSKLTPTRWRKPGFFVTDPSADPQGFFSLEAVYVAWLLRDTRGAEYMKQTREFGLTIGFVSVTERKSVVDWLEGRVDNHERLIPLHVESTTPPGTPPQSSYSRTPSTSPKKTAQPESASSPTKRRYVVDQADVEMVKKIKQNEIELKDCNTILRGIKPNNFSSIRLAYAEKLKKLKEATKSGAVPPAPSPSKDPKMQARKPRHMDAIIMISSSPTALITMHNVKRFLQESTFETSIDARARAAAEGNPRPEDTIPIYRKCTTIDSSGKEHETHARYFVVDSIEALAKFGADAWDRVVCVMTTGQAWQFKPYKWTEPRTLFHHVKGIYVTWSNDPPNPKIKDWNVTELKIDPHRRHVDKSVVAHFWKILDTWTLANKPWLMKS